jgi:hypothetical protein
MPFILICKYELIQNQYETQSLKDVKKELLIRASRDLELLNYMGISNKNVYNNYVVYKVNTSTCMKNQRRIKETYMYDQSKRDLIICKTNKQIDVPQKKKDEIEEAFKLANSLLDKKNTSTKLFDGMYTRDDEENESITENDEHSEIDSISPDIKSVNSDMEKDDENDSISENDDEHSEVDSISLDIKSVNSDMEKYDENERLSFLAEKMEQIKRNIVDRKNRIKDDANKDDANKDDANKDDANKDDANKDDANKDEDNNKDDERLSFLAEKMEQIKRNIVDRKNRIKELEKVKERVHEGIADKACEVNLNKRTEKERKEKEEQNRRKYESDIKVYKKLKKEIDAKELTEEQISSMFSQTYQVIKEIDLKNELDKESAYDTYIQKMNEIKEACNKETHLYEKYGIF